MFSLFVKNNIYKKRLIILLASFSIIFVLPNTSHAATLTVGPSSGTYAVGKTFSVSFYNNSINQSTNAVSGAFTYSPATLEITGSSKSGSIINLWTQEPSYSNSSGTGLFEGIILNPGFTGTNGKIVTYTFRVKSAGTGFIKIGSSSILANDGNGTNILTGSSGATFTFISAVKEPVPVVSPISETIKPITIPTVPTVHNNGVLIIQELENIPQNSFKQFKIAVINTPEIIKKYEIRIDQQDPVIWEDSKGDGIYTAPLLKTGKHTLLVKALDTLSTYNGYIDFSIIKLSSPVLFSYTKQTNLTQQPIVIYGNTTEGTVDVAVTAIFNYADNQVYSETVNPDINGNFIFIIDKKLIPGNYTMTVYSSNTQGLMSEPTVPVTIRVHRYPFLDLGFITIPIIVVFAICFMLLTMSTILIIYFYIRLKRAKLSRTKRLANLVKDINL